MHGQGVDITNMTKSQYKYEPAVQHYKYYKQILKIVLVLVQNGIDNCKALQCDKFMVKKMIRYSRSVPNQLPKRRPLGARRLWHSAIVPWVWL